MGFDKAYGEYCNGADKRTAAILELIKDVDVKRYGSTTSLLARNQVRHEEVLRNHAERHNNHDARDDQQDEKIVQLQNTVREQDDVIRQLRAKQDELEQLVRALLTPTEATPGRTKPTLVNGPYQTHARERSCHVLQPNHRTVEAMRQLHAYSKKWGHCMCSAQGTV